MLTRIFAAVGIAFALAAIAASYTQRSAFYLGQENQPTYWPRHGTQLSGRYRSGVWVPLPGRTTYEGFQGGGPGLGK